MAKKSKNLFNSITISQCFEVPLVLNNFLDFHNKEFLIFTKQSRLTTNDSVLKSGLIFLNVSLSVDVLLRRFGNAEFRQA